MIIYVSTIGRGKDASESSHIRKVNFDTGETLAVVRLPAPMIELGNPRGGVRGARGLCFYNGLLYAASWDAIFELDPDDLFIRKGWWARDCQDIHQIYSSDNGILICNTKYNAINRFTPETGEFVDIDVLTDIIPGAKRRNGSPSNPDVYHFNSFHNDYLLFPDQGALASLSERKVLMKDMDQLVGCHDVQVLNNGRVAINQSKLRRTSIFMPDPWRLAYTVLQLQPTPGENTALAAGGYTRGLFYLKDEDALLVGASPAKIVKVSNVSSSDGPHSIREIEISDDVARAVFDVIKEP